MAINIFIFDIFIKMPTLKHPVKSKHHVALIYLTAVQIQHLNVFPLGIYYSFNLPPERLILHQTAWFTCLPSCPVGMSTQPHK